MSNAARYLPKAVRYLAFEAGALAVMIFLLVALHSSRLDKAIIMTAMIMLSGALMASLIRRRRTASRSRGR